MESTFSGFLSSWRIQRRVLSALLRREFISLTGKTPIGFLLVILEPLVFVVCMTVLFLIRGNKFGNIPVVAFAISGYSILWGVRFHINRSLGVLQANRPLLYHRNVKIIDIFIARGFVQTLTTTMSVVLLIPMILFRVIAFPDTPFLVVFSWFFVQWYGLSMSIVANSITGLTSFGGKIAALLGVLHIWITGAFFMVEWIPVEYQKYVLVFPMVHATEMMRDGLFGSMVLTHYSVAYLFISNIVVTYIALVMWMKLVRKGAINDSN